MALPSPCPLPLGTDCCLSPNTSASPRWWLAQLALCATVPVFRGVDFIPPCREPHRRNTRPLWPGPACLLPLLSKKTPICLLPLPVSSGSDDCLFGRGSRELYRFEAWCWRAESFTQPWRTSGKKGSFQVIRGHPRSRPHQLQPSKLPEASASSSGAEVVAGGRETSGTGTLLSGTRGAASENSLWFSNLHLSLKTTVWFPTQADTRHQPQR